MPKDIPLSDAEQSALLRRVMSRQATLSLRVASVFLVLIFGLPMVNWLLPNVAGARVGGFSLSWLFLGVLFYPLTWLLSGYFIRASDKIENELAVEHKQNREAGK
ncbi:MAG: DUF485 domain-containing protein [Alphaproteobacteria bacterium]|nr:MAG: DUF485 domain-containing protein [Alphaproteobacteria bacterium]